MSFLSWFRRKKGDTDDVKEGEGRYYLGEDKVYHFYGDCKKVVGVAKVVSSRESIKYELCKTCSERHSKSAHRARRRMLRKLPGWAEELRRNIEESDMPEDEKEKALSMGLITMFATYSLSVLLDRMGRKPRRKKLNIGKIRKSISYAEGDISLWVTNGPQNITLAQKKSMLARVNKGIRGALLNGGGHGGIEVAIEHIGDALRAIVELDYQHTVLNPPEDGRLGKDTMVYVAFCEIRRALYQQTWFNMCQINSDYEDYFIKQRMALKG